MIILPCFEGFFTGFAESITIISNSIISVLNSCAFKLGGYNVSFGVILSVLLVLCIVIFLFSRGARS